MVIRVRYSECDPMGVAHHTVYPIWFEMGRTELLRERGLAYRDLEAKGVFLAIIELEVKYHKPAKYDDELRLQTRVAQVSKVRITHDYKLYRDGDLLATARTTLACLDREGRLQAVPDSISTVI